MLNYDEKPNFMKSQRISHGMMCQIKLDISTLSEEGYTMIEGTRDARLFQKINMREFPSISNFLGESTQVSDGDFMLIIECAGRPDKIRPGPRWSSYDVYDVLVHGVVRQIFRHNITSLIPCP